jgi:hypothetical protein
MFFFNLEVNEADDWMGVSQQKLLLEQGLEAVGDEENRKQKVANRLEQSRQRVKLVDRMNKTSGSTFPSFSLSEKKQKRRLENNENEEDFDRQIEGGDFSNSGANENDVNNFSLKISQL